MLNNLARVRVRIANRARWNLEAANALDGRYGVVEEIKPIQEYDGATATPGRQVEVYLVKFDEPAPVVRGMARTKFHFEADDLESVVDEVATTGSPE